MQSSLVAIQNAAGTENMAKFIENGAVELYNNNSKVFYTQSGGVTVDGITTLGGNVTVEGNLSMDGYHIDDLEEVRFDQGNNQPRIKRVGSNALDIQGANVSITGGGSNNPANGNLTVAGDLTVNGSIIHGGGGTTKGGTFTGSSALTDGVQGNLFTLTRANTGTLMFDVWLTSGDNTTESICKRFTVARSYGVVSPPFNKLIDTGPVSGNDFAVSFVGDSTTGVICKVTPSGTNQTISYTVMVGFDSVNTLTVS